MEFSVSLKKNHEFRRLYEKGRSATTPLLVVYFRRTNREYNQVGITVGTKIGNAVCRNRIRRQIREIYRLNESKLQKGLDIVIVARMRSRYVSYAELEKAYLFACSRLGILSGMPENGEKQ
ncbi:MAG: ribonuclease P protein component [Clostridiales bacterium]|nr:ribonuclease P protein component [Clostridiales bacterium]